MKAYKSSDVGKGFGSGGGGGTILQASGGEIVLGANATIDGTDYKYHYFKTPGTFLIPDAVIFDEEIDVLVIAGGAAGGQRSGGGGGAKIGIAVAEQVPFGSSSGQLSIPITVGGGGPINNPGGQGRGNNGSDSRFAGPGDSWNVSAAGGGGGGGDSPNSGASGGSGGGGHYSAGGGSATQPNQNPGKSSWVTNYGNVGNSGHGAPQHNSGAGGGAGSAALGGSPNQRGQAGDGVQLPNWGVSYYMPNTDPWWLVYHLYQELISVVAVEQEIIHHTYLKECPMMLPMVVVVLEDLIVVQGMELLA